MGELLLDHFLAQLLELVFLAGRGESDPRMGERQRRKERERWKCRIDDKMAPEGHC
jgi:hypothetical protein